MSLLFDRGRRFDHFPEALYVVDCHFQETNRPLGSTMDTDRLYSGKFKLHGYKTEVCVLPIGVAVMFSPHYDGSVHDYDIFRDRLNEHVNFAMKEPGENSIPDLGEGAEEFGDRWAFLCDKAYQVRYMNFTKK